MHAQGMRKTIARRLTLRQTLCGHTAAITCLVAAPNHGIVMSASADGACIIWDMTRLTVRLLCMHRLGEDAAQCPSCMRVGLCCRFHRQPSRSGSGSSGKMAVGSCAAWKQRGTVRICMLSCLFYGCCQGVGPESRDLQLLFLSMGQLVVVVLSNVRCRPSMDQSISVSSSSVTRRTSMDHAWNTRFSYLIGSAHARVLQFVRQLQPRAGPVAAVALNILTGDMVVCARDSVTVWTINGDLLACSECGSLLCRVVLTCSECGSLLCRVVLVCSECGSLLCGVWL